MFVNLSKSSLELVFPIKRLLFVDENILEFDLGRCSGYYVFDVEWVKINGKWKYRHTLLDSVSNCIVADAIYDFEDETTVTFLEIVKLVIEVPLNA